MYFNLRSNDTKDVTYPVYQLDVDLRTIEPLLEENSSKYANCFSFFVFNESFIILECKVNETVQIQLRNTNDLNEVVSWMEILEVGDITKVRILHHENWENYFTLILQNGSLTLSTLYTINENQEFVKTNTLTTAISLSSKASKNYIISYLGSKVQLLTFDSF